jgi:hypothetical protein
VCLSLSLNCAMIRLNLFCCEFRVCLCVYDICNACVYVCVLCVCVVCVCVHTHARAHAHKRTQTYTIPYVSLAINWSNAAVLLD